MSGYRSGITPAMSSTDFNAKAKALSERLGPMPRSVKPSRPPQKWGDRAPPQKSTQTNASKPEAEQDARRPPYGAFRPWIAVVMVVCGLGGLGVLAWLGLLVQA